MTCIYLFIFSFQSDVQLADRVLEALPNLEIYNSIFTPNFGEWALGYCGDVYNKENPGSSSIHENDTSLHSVTSLDLSNRRIHNVINKVLTFPSSILLIYIPFLFLFILLIFG